MQSEKPVPLPLSGEEVQVAILHKVSESLERTCHLKSDNAYTSFSAEVTIKLRLSDYGREVADNHIVTASEGELPPETPEQTVTVEVPHTPPNQVRIDTGQDIPVTVKEGSKSVIRRVKYQARKPRK